ncbi:MAG TPA: cytochrome c oxidase assembly protein, partial [Candidatus Binatia bacterium]
TVRFDSNVGPELPWRFQPNQRAIGVELGENVLGFFRAENLSDRAVTGHASFNVAPARAARYFTKIECFCFTEQTLEPGQSLDMPVSFFIDPEMLNDRDAAGVTEFTLSYTFFLSTRASTAAVAAAEGKG